MANNGLKVLHEKMTIEMTKAFAKAITDARSEEYALLQKVRNDYPTYSVVKRTVKHKKSQEHYAGLTYEYMETYIMALGTMEERVKNLKDFNELRMIAMCHSKARAFPFIRSWFLDLFPEVEKFGVKIAKVEVEEEIDEEEEQLALPAPAAEKIPA